MEIKYYLKRLMEETETAIFARVSYSEQKIKILPTQKQPPRNGILRLNALMPPQGGQKLNSYLDSSITDIKNVYDKYVLIHNIHPSTDTFKELLDKEFKDNRTWKNQIKGYWQTFYIVWILCRLKGEGWWERTNPKTSKPISKNTIKTYKTTEKLLKEFQKDTRRNIDFNTIDLDFYEALKKYTLNNRYSDNIKEKKELM